MAVSIQQAQKSGVTHRLSFMALADSHVATGAFVGIVMLSNES